MRVIAGLVRVLSLLGHLLSLSLHLSKLLFIFRNSTYYCFRFLYYFLNQVREDYDYIIIDTQPTRDSLLLTNAINAADYVLIPSLCEANSQESAFRTYALCNELRNTPGSHLKGIGVILTMVVKKAASTKIIRDQCKQVLGASLYKTEIPSGLSVNMSVTKHLPVCFMAKTQPVAVAYNKAYEELKSRLEKIGVN